MHRTFTRTFAAPVFDVRSEFLRDALLQEGGDFWGWDAGYAFLELGRDLSKCPKLIIMYWSSEDRFYLEAIRPNGQEGRAFSLLTNGNFDDVQEVDTGEEIFRFPKAFTAPREQAVKLTLEFFEQGELPAGVIWMPHQFLSWSFFKNG